MFKFKVGDEVLINTGKDKGKKGKIEKVLESENRVVVENVNVYKRHKKAAVNQQAGIVEITRPIDASKVTLICPKCSKPTRIGFKKEGNVKTRICKKCKGVVTK